MNLVARAILGFFFVAVIFGMMFLLYLKKKHPIVNPVPKESRLEILKKYSEYNTSKESKKYPAAFVLNNKIPDILFKI